MAESLVGKGTGHPDHAMMDAQDMRRDTSWEFCDLVSDNPPSLPNRPY